MRRHGWYIVPQMIPFALFSSQTSHDDKSVLASKILTFEHEIPVSYPLVKPTFPEISESTNIVDLVSKESFMFFTILKTDWQWLHLSPLQWEDNPSYKEAETFVRTVKVLNDLAERGIKLITDYAHCLTKDEEMRKILLHGVEQNRRKYPDFRKKTLNCD